MKKKVLVIPSDSIDNEVSRSFYFAKHLSDDYEVYLLKWKDIQSVFFKEEKPSKLTTLRYWLASIFTSIRIEKHPKYSYSWIHLPYMSYMVIYRFIGVARARKLAAKFNQISLNKVLARIQPDAIFAADGFERFQAVEGYPIMADIQDDFDEASGKYPPNHLEYLKKCFRFSQKSFAVTNKVAKRLGKIYEADIEYLPNGADLTGLRGISKESIEDWRKKLNLAGKTVISYIGADAWYDTTLAESIYELAEKQHPHLHFVLVGNLQKPKKNYSNVTFTGGVDSQTAYIFYHLSDMGLFFKDSKGSDFLLNSMPLKIIQYASLNRPTILPPIAWLLEEEFSNIATIENYTAENILAKIQEIQANPLPYDVRWEEYEWDKVVVKIKHALVKILKH